MRAVVIDKSDAGQAAGLGDFPETDLMEGDVVVRRSTTRMGWPLPARPLWYGVSR